MTLADLPRITEIEKLAYTTPWPPSAYRKELQDNPMAHYIVVRDLLARDAYLRGAANQGAIEVPRRTFPLSLLPGRQNSQMSPSALSIVGFAGLWLMINEAHVTTIAVHPSARGHGLGELMLSTLVGIAYDISARYVTLEVRVSNIVAQNLYRKYGFRDVGIRRRYYSDNAEDALIMGTEDIRGEAYRARYASLQRALVERLAAEEAVEAPDTRQRGTGTLGAGPRAEDW